MLFSLSLFQETALFLSTDGKNSSRTRKGCNVLSGAAHADVFGLWFVSVSLMCGCLWTAVTTLWPELPLLRGIFGLVGGDLSAEGSEENKVASTKRLQETSSQEENNLSERVLCEAVSAAPA